MAIISFKRVQRWKKSKLAAKNTHTMCYACVRMKWVSWIQYKRTTNSNNTQTYKHAQRTQRSADTWNSHTNEPNWVPLKFNRSFNNNHTVHSPISVLHRTYGFGAHSQHNTINCARHALWMLYIYSLYIDCMYKQNDIIYTFIHCTVLCCVKCLPCCSVAVVVLNLHLIHIPHNSLSKVFRYTHIASDRITSLQTYQVRENRSVCQCHDIKEVGIIKTDLISFNIFASFASHRTYACVRDFKRLNQY